MGGWHYTTAPSQAFGYIIKPLPGNEKQLYNIDELPFWSTQHVNNILSDQYYKICNSSKANVEILIITASEVSYEAVSLTM